jgi:Chlorophyllase
MRSRTKETALGAREGSPRRILSRSACVMAVALSAALGAPPATVAEGLPTAQSQATYAAFDPWVSSDSSQPDKCQETKSIYISQPDAGGRYPVLFYLHGTMSDWGQNAEGQLVAQLAAAQGFVAAAVTYDSWVTAYTPSGIDGHAECIFGAANSSSALARVCALPKADCSGGVLVSGFSQGGAIAVRAANFSSQVRAAWTIGVNGPAISQALAAPAGDRKLPNERLRMNVGQSDVQVTDPTTGRPTGLDFGALNAMTGMRCVASPCLGPTGSGYVVVQNAEVADGIADHCYWQSVNSADPADSCTWFPELDPGFPPPGSASWSLLANLQWLRAQLKTTGPPVAPRSRHRAHRRSRRCTSRSSAHRRRPHGRCKTKRRYVHRRSAKA